MLGNFSIGDYFKARGDPVRLGPLARGLRLRPDDIWVTVFAGDEQLGLGPDEEAIELWQAVGVPRERIVAARALRTSGKPARSAPAAPARSSTSTAASPSARPDDLPGGENERFLEYWNLVFMQYDQDPHDHRLSPLPANNIDTGLGLNRLAAILQGKDSVFDTDQFQPLIDLGRELSGRRHGEDPAADRALRILADHARGMSFLIADGVVPPTRIAATSCAGVTRRAILQGRRLEMAPGFLLRYAERRPRADGRRLPGADRSARCDRALARRRGGRASGARSSRARVSWMS